MLLAARWDGADATSVGCCSASPASPRFTPCQGRPSGGVRLVSARTHPGGSRGNADRSPHRAAAEAHESCVSTVLLRPDAETGGEPVKNEFVGQRRIIGVS